MTQDELKQEIERLRRQLDFERRYNRMLNDAIRNYTISLLQEINQLRATHDPYAQGEE